MISDRPRRVAGIGTGGGFGVELNLTSLARPPSPAEERAIFLAVEEALRAAITPPSEPEPPRWRFSGRWWRTNTNPGTVFPHCG